MSLDQKRNEVGKLLACLLVSRKGVCSITQLENDYNETEGKVIPYRDFGCHSTIDFLRTIPNHVRLSSRNGDYSVEPVVSDKIKHVNDLVVRQKWAKKNTPRSRRPARYSRYYPQVREPRPFIRNSVQREIAHMLVNNPSGVDTRSIAQCLENSNTIATPVDMSNIDDYINRVPHIAVANGSLVYPSRSLTATNEAKQRKTPTTADGHTANMSQSMPESSSSRNVAYPGGIEDSREFYDDEDYYDDFADEDFAPEPFVQNNYAAGDNYRPEESSRFHDDHDRTKLSSAEFIARARLQEQQRQNHVFANGNTDENPNIRVEVDDEGDNNTSYQSEDETVDIINLKLRTRLEQLIKKHPDGIWCANLLQTFLDEYKFPLDYVELGFASVCELAASLGKIFRIHRWNDRGDFMLYDASQPLPSAPKESETRSDSPVWEDEMTDNEDVEPFPMTMALHATEKLIPNDVMTQKESVGQERIPEISDDEDCIEVYVADVYTPSLFWILLRKKRNKLRQLMDAMHDFYQQEGDKYTIPHVILEKGLNCVCLFEGTWHRAIIKTVKPDGDVTLIFYDFGTTKTYPPDSVRYLHRRFTNLPAQSIACGLYNVKPVNSDTWTRGASAEFWNKVRDLPLMAIVIKIDRENNSMLVSLVDTQNEEDFHMNDWMVQQKLAKYGSMATVTTDTTPYCEEPEISEQDTTTELANVPLIRPHTTMIETSESTLKPPPGFAKISEPSNIAAFLDSCMDGTSYNATEFGRPTYMNFCNVNLSNNPLAPQNATNNPLIFPAEVIIQLLKNQLEMELQKQIDDKLAEACRKLAIASLNPSMVNGTTLNNSNTDPSTSYTNPFPEQSNPFHEEFATATNNFEAFNQFSTNLSSNKSNNPFGNANDTTSRDIAELSNVGCTVSNGSSINSEKLSSELRSLVTQESCNKADLNPIHENLNSFNPESDTRNTANFIDNKSHLIATNAPNGQPEANGISEKTLFDEARFLTNPKKTNNEEFVNQQFHCTNPFKVRATENSVNSVESKKEQSFKIKVENFDNNNKPPIPPRNPNLINRSLNLTPRNPTTHVKSVELPTVPNEIPTTKVYYEAKAVMYDRRKIEETSKSTDTIRQSTEKLNREPSKSSSKKEMVSKTSNSEITHTAQFIKQESFSQLEQNTKLTPSIEHLRSHYQNNTDPHSPERTGGFKFTFKPVIDTKKPTAAQYHDGFELDKRQNACSHSPTLYSSQASLNEQNSLEINNQNPGVTSKSDVTMGNENSKSPDTNTRSMPSHAFPSYHNNPHHQPQVQNTMPQYVPLHIPGPMQYGPNYPYHMSQPMQYLGTNQRMPTFRPGAPVYYPPAPNWSGTQFYNPGYAHQYPNAPNVQQYSQLWKQYNSLTSTRKIAQPTYRTETVQSKANLKSEIDKSSVLSSSSSGTNQAQTTLPQENKENIDTSQHDQMSSSPSEFTHHNTEPLTTPTSTASLSRKTSQGLTNAHSNDTSNLKECNLSTQLHDVSSQSPDQDTFKKKTENSIEKSRFAKASSSSETLPMATPKKNLEESFNKNLNSLPQSSPNKPMTRIFKPVETNNQTIYLFNIENQGWVCTDEITQTFTEYPSRNAVLRILEKLGVEIDFIEVNRTQSPMLFSQLDNTKLRLPRMPNTKKIKGSLHLTPLKSLARMMVVLQVVTDEEIQSLRIAKAPPPGSILPELVKLITAYKITDEYWVS